MPEHRIWPWLRSRICRIFGHSEWIVVERAGGHLGWQRVTVCGRCEGPTRPEWSLAERISRRRGRIKLGAVETVGKVRVGHD